MTESVPPQVPPNYTRMAKTVAEVADNLEKARYFAGLWRNWTSEKIKKRGEAYMNGSRRLIEQCGPLMKPDDKDTAVAKYEM